MQGFKTQAIIKITGLGEQQASFTSISLIGTHNEVIGQYSLSSISKDHLISESFLSPDVTEYYVVLNGYINGESFIRQSHNAIINLPLKLPSRFFDQKLIISLWNSELAGLNIEGVYESQTKTGYPNFKNCEGIEFWFDEDSSRWILGPKSYTFHPLSQLVSKPTWTNCEDDYDDYDTCVDYEGVLITSLNVELVSIDSLIEFEKMKWFISLNGTWTELDMNVTKVNGDKSLDLSYPGYLPSGLDFVKDETTTEAMTTISSYYKGKT